MILASYGNHSLSPPHRLPLGVPLKIAIMKNSKHAGDDGKRVEKPLFLSFSLPSCPACFLFYFSPVSLRHKGLCIKVGRGQGDGDIGTRVWGLGTWGRKTRDLRTSSMGRGDVWDGDTGTSNTGTQGTRDVNDYRKSRR